MTPYQKYKADLYRLRKGEARGNSNAGVYGCAIRTQAEVAAILGYTPQRVQQIEREALKKLARKLGRKDQWI